MLRTHLRVSFPDKISPQYNENTLWTNYESYLLVNIRIDSSRTTQKGGRPRGKQKSRDDYDDDFSFKEVKDTLGVQDSGEESAKENEEEKLQEKAKRQRYKKQLETVIRWVRGIEQG